MPPNPWHARAGELADWALARFFVRRDRYGGYCGAGPLTLPTKKDGGAKPGVVDRALLVRHFCATRTEHVVGAHLLAEGASLGRYLVADIDDHGGTDAGANARHGADLHRRFSELGFRPLAARWGGSVHVAILFRDTQPGAALRRFALDMAPDVGGDRFPAGPECRPGTYGGGWCRIVGRHHTRDQWAEVFDGSDWLAGAAAVAHLLSLTGDAIDLSETPPEPPLPSPAPAFGAPGGAARGCDVLREYNRCATIDVVASWHEAAGHRVLRRRADRVEFVRAGKRGGESFNVAVRGDVALTFNFSTRAGLPVARALNPAQVRCWYECGACDAAALRRFADRLRVEMGLTRGRR